MAIVIRILDRVIFFILGLFFGLLGLVFILAKGLVRKKTSFPKKTNPLNRLSFCIMDLEKAKDKGDLIEDILLNGAISKEIAVFFDFEAKEDSMSRIGDNIDYYRFSIHRKEDVINRGFRKTGAVFRLIKNISFLINLCRKEDVNCVQSHEAVFLGFIGLIFSRLLRAPFVLHLNMSYEEKYIGTGKLSFKFLYFRRIERYFEYMSVRLADIIMADREFYKNSKFFPKSSVKKYITTGIKVGKDHYIEASARHNLKKDLHIIGRDAILYVGRLHPVKYVRDLIEAFEKIYKKDNRAFLLIVGEGILEKELKNMIQKYGLEKHVLFLGSKTQKELRDLFFTADVIVQPHGGQVLLEAALAGTPSVVYDFDWHREFVQDGKMGFIVPFRNTEELARKTLNLLLDKQLNEKLGFYSRDMAVSKYSRQKSIDNEKQIYNNLIRA